MMFINRFIPFAITQSEFLYICPINNLCSKKVDLFVKFLEMLLVGMSLFSLMLKFSAQVVHPILLIPLLNQRQNINISKLANLMNTEMFPYLTIQDLFLLLQTTLVILARKRYRFLVDQEIILKTFRVELLEARHQRNLLVCLFNACNISYQKVFICREKFIKIQLKVRYYHIP